MTDNEIKKALERLKSTKDYLKEQYQEQVKKCPYPELKPIAKQTYEDNKKAFDIAIKAIEKFNRLQAENERLKKGWRADVVEVVRCKDCKICELRYPVKAIGEEAIEAYYCYTIQRYVKPNDFCSYGEKGVR